MKVGDLVEIEKWCKKNSRIAVLLEANEYLRCV